MTEGAWGACCSSSADGTSWASRIPSGTTILAGTNGPVAFSGGNVTAVTATDNEKVRVWFALRRDNANAAGSGTYEITLDGVVVSPGFRGSGSIEQTVPGVYEMTVPIAGPHSIGVKLTAATGDETVDSGSMLVNGSNVS